MYVPFASVCDDFYVNMRLATQLSLPHNRETVLHFFERVQRQFPEMSRFRKYDNGDLSIEENRYGPDAKRHFGLECTDVDGLRKKLEGAGFKTEDGRPVPWKRFLVCDPFGNRIEIHDIGGLRE